jgi:hypothetical protein
VGRGAQGGPQKEAAAVAGEKGRIARRRREDHRGTERAAQGERIHALNTEAPQLQIRDPCFCWRSCRIDTQRNPPPLRPQKSVESNHKKNRAEEAEYIKQRDGALKAGLKGKDSWEKVRGPGARPGDRARLVGLVGAWSGILGQWRGISDFRAAACVVGCCVFCVEPGVCEPFLPRAFEKI